MNSKFRLNTGFEIPLIGFGTYKIQGGDYIFNTLDAALNIGYRLIGELVNFVVYFNLILCFQTQPLCTATNITLAKL
jgi:hypothetical protein